jgi:hypothetical protein
MVDSESDSAELERASVRARGGNPPARNRASESHPGAHRSLTPACVGSLRLGLTGKSLCLVEPGINSSDYRRSRRDPARKYHSQQSVSVYRVPFAFSACGRRALLGAMLDGTVGSPSATPAARFRARVCFESCHSSYCMQTFTSMDCGCEASASSPRWVMA